MYEETNNLFTNQQILQWNKDCIITFAVLCNPPLEILHKSSFALRGLFGHAHTFLVNILAFLLFLCTDETYIAACLLITHLIMFFSFLDNQIKLIDSFYNCYREPSALKLYISVCIKQFQNWVLGFLTGTNVTTDMCCDNYLYDLDHLNINMIAVSVL